MQQVSAAAELPFVLVACVGVCGAIGVGIDRLLKSGPFGMLVCGAVGLAAGVREIIRRTSRAPGV
jgi:F0F1-type ATP synthase assembly protein I